MINKALAGAAFLSLGFTAVHVFWGGPEVHSALLQSDASALNKGVVSVLWHAVTATMLICSGLLALAARQIRHRRILSAVVGLIYGGYIALFLFYGMARFGSLLVLPQWIGFAIILLLALAGQPGIGDRRLARSGMPQ